MSNVKSLNIGNISNIANNKDKEMMSGIFKSSVQVPVFLTFTNLKGDEQADLVNHGGVDKAVCLYSVEHLLYWEQRYNQPFGYGGFGENISIQGLTEKDVCIGDVFKWGGAIVQVSQPRKPCYKLAERHQLKQLPLHILETGFSGYYVRVLEEGQVSVEDSFSRIERGSEYSIADVNRLTFSEDVKQRELEDLLLLNSLSTAWKESLAKKVSKLSN